MSSRLFNQNKLVAVPSRSITHTIRTCCTGIGRASSINEPYLLLSSEALCSFLKGRKFPGTVRITRAGDESAAETDSKAESSAPPSRGAALSSGVEIAASYVEDRQSRSLQGEPSTSEQVRRLPPGDIHPPKLYAHQ